MSFDHRTKIQNTTYNLHQALTLYLRDRAPAQHGGTRPPITTHPLPHPACAAPWAHTHFRLHRDKVNLRLQHADYYHPNRFFVVKGALSSPSRQWEKAFCCPKGLSRVPGWGKRAFCCRRGSISSPRVRAGRGESECFSTLRAGSHCSAPCNMKDECSAPCNMNVIAALSFDEMATHTSPVVSSRTGPAPITRGAEKDYYILQLIRNYV